MKPTNQPISISIPQGKACIVNFTTDAAYMQAYRIKDARGNVVASGEGNGGGPSPKQPEVFVAQLGGDYTVEITGNGRAEQVMCQDSSVVYNGQIYAQNYLFLGEDSTDNDFNDTVLSVTWLQKNR